MFSKSFVSLAVLSALSLSQPALGRMRWMERDDKPVMLNPRRFGQENPAILQELSAACDGGVCATLAGQAISTLLAGAGECAQQDLADEIINAAAQFDAATQENMINIAIEFRQAEKNTPPDFTTNPPTLRNSVFCQKAPANAQLNGLVQAQDPANDPNIFFDPALKISVQLGAQANTFPFGVDANVVAAAPAADAAADVDVADAAADADVADAAADADVADAAADVDVVNAAVVGDFGDCSVPQIVFGVGFDNRKETSFQPADLASFNHGSAQNINIITKFICDTLVNSCGADQAALDTCQLALEAAAAAADKTGAQADAFNAVFGIDTNFAIVVSIDNQGNAIAGTGDPAAAAAADAAAADADAAAADPASAADIAAAALAAAADPAAAADAAAAAAAEASENVNENADAVDVAVQVQAGNLQIFVGALGGVVAPAVNDLGNGEFQVVGNASFKNLESALVRSCDVQNNQCSNAANSSGNEGELNVQACGAQQAQCISQARGA